MAFSWAATDTGPTPKEPIGERQQGRPDEDSMEARVIDKKKLPSRHVTEGPQRAPHRSYYYAMGLSSET